MSRIPPNRQELANLVAVARREIADSDAAGLSNDGRFEHAYAAALAIATIVVRALGQRIHGADHHRLTFEALADAENGRWREVADYLQHCRARRNVLMYDRTGAVSVAEADDLRRRARELLADVERWLRKQHGDLAP